MTGNTAHKAPQAVHKATVRLPDDISRLKETAPKVKGKSPQRERKRHPTRKEKK